MTQKVFYFAMPAPSKGYDVSPYEEGMWLVFVRHPDTPMWWREVAQFRDEDRALAYAYMENDLFSDDVSQRPDEMPAVGLPELSPSALEKIAAAVKVGNILAAPPTEPAQLPVTIVSYEASSAAQLVPRPKPKAKKKANAHFPSDKWDEPATKRLVDLRAEGKPFGEIAQILNEEFPGRGYTKSACTAKADRLGLPKSVDTKAVDEVSLEDDWNHGRFPMEEDDVLSDVILEEATKPEYDVSPTQIREAIHWYRSLRHVVYHYKNEGKIQVDHGEMISPAEFLTLVNPERERMSLPPFVEQQEAAD